MARANIESNNLNLSVIIPTYNRAGMICRAIDSVISQLTVDDEIIVIDDGSTDGTEELLNKVRDRIIYRRISHGGAGRARNEGIAIAHNGLIAFLDSDDEWMPKKIELQRALLQARPDVVFCFSDYAFRYSSGPEEYQRLSDVGLYQDKSTGEHILGPGVPFSSIAPLPEGMHDFMVHIGDLYGKQMERELVSVITLTYRRGSEHEADLKYPEDLPTREDWEFVGKLARKGLAAYLDCETAIAYQHEGPELVKLDDLTHLNARIKLVERVWGVDTEYLKDHREEYLRVDHVLHKSLVREFLLLGRTQEAREEIRKDTNIPMTYKLLSRFPGFVNRSLFSSPLPGLAYWSRSLLKKIF